DTVAQMRAILDKHGAKASALGLWGWNHLAPDAATRQESHRQFDRAIQFGEKLGASILITGGGDIPNAPLAQKVEEFGKVFPPFVAKAKNAGLKIALYAVHGNSFFTSVEAYEQAWKVVPDVGIKFDPANWRHHGDDYLAVVRKHGNRIFYVHIKEHLYMGSELASQPAAGMGDIQWGKVMAFLYEHDYQGYLSIEPHGPKWSRPPLRRKMLLLTQRHIKQFLA
ncbi:MAG: sugar phosphate isomerase/epimerase, partial [Planctomycetes bacterium]|nr:sugar phosphate isomerase/epimerase [Planctomycetota bacterium]